MQLDEDAARLAMAPLATKLKLDVETLAEGVIRLANEHMAQALRVISIQQGFDPRKFSLMCFGGAGGLHVCDLAETLEIPEAIVPLNSGILSAQGMVISEPGRELVQTYRTLLTHLNAAKLKQYIGDLIEQARQELEAEGVEEIQYVASLDLRYLGQSHTLNIEYDSITRAAESFHAEHHKQYGHRTEIDIELLNIRLSAAGFQAPIMLPSLPSDSITSTRYDGSDAIFEGSDDSNCAKVRGLKTVTRNMLNANDQLIGPLLILEDHATTYVKQGWGGMVDTEGNIRLKRMAAG